jgi:hypothetical protein
MPEEKKPNDLDPRSIPAQVDLDPRSISTQVDLDPRSISTQVDLDPRHRLAQKYLRNAHRELASKDAEKPRRHRPRGAARQPVLADLRPSISGSTWLHGFMLAIVVTVALQAVALCYHFFIQIPLVGRVIAMPAGIFFFLAISYASAFYLGVIESTSHGHTDPDHALEGDWRDWFWTLPATWGVLAAVAALGWFISGWSPWGTWRVVRPVVWLLYPVFQLSTLETGSPALPFSLPVLRSLATRPLIWITFYGLSFGLAVMVSWLAQVTWRDPPWMSLLGMGPIVTFALFVYAWLLGQVARWLALRGE